MKYSIDCIGEEGYWKIHAIISPFCLACKKIAERLSLKIGRAEGSSSYAKKVYVQMD